MREQPAVKTRRLPPDFQATPVARSSANRCGLSQLTHPPQQPDHAHGVDGAVAQQRVAQVCSLGGGHGVAAEQQALELDGRDQRTFVFEAIEPTYDCSTALDK